MKYSENVTNSQQFLTKRDKNHVISMNRRKVHMFRPLIEFCVNNLASGSQEAMETLEKDLDLDVIDYGCLNECGQCARSLFALVDGEVVTGETPDELVKNIYKQIEDHVMF